MLLSVLNEVAQAENVNVSPTITPQGDTDKIRPTRCAGAECTPSEGDLEDHSANLVALASVLDRELITDHQSVIYAQLRY